MLWNRDKKKKPYPNYCEKCGVPFVRFTKKTSSRYDPETGDEFYTEYTFYGCGSLKDKHLSDFGSTNTWSGNTEYTDGFVHKHPFYLIEKNPIIIPRENNDEN